MTHPLSITKRARRWLAAICSVVVMMAPLAHAETSLSVDLAPSSGTTQDLFVFTVTVDGSRSASPPSFGPSQDFEIEMLGPQSFIASINGVTTQRISFVYNLTPKGAGTLKTPSVTLQADGRTFEHAPIEVEVAKADQRRLGSEASGGAPEAVFLRQFATPTTIYEGQQLINTLDLYTSVGLSDIKLDDLATDGFWQEPVTDGDRSQRQVNGFEYHVVQVAKALYPLRSGLLNLPPRTLNATAQIPKPQRGPSGLDPFDPFSQDLFGTFFRAVEERRLSLESNELHITVKPLPPAPPELQALVGSVPIVGTTKVSAETSLDTLKVGESKSITIHVSSEGNLNPLSKLPLSAPQGVKVYEERPDTKRDRRGGKLILHRFFRFSVVPLKPGLLRIPGAQVAFFNPSTGQYQLAKSEDITLAVQGEALPDPSAQGGLRAAQVPTLEPLPIGPDLDYEEASILERISDTLSLKSAILLASVLIAIAILMGLIGKLRPKAAPPGLTSSDLDAVESIADLEAFTRHLLARRIPAIKPESSVDEIRARIAQEIKNPDVAVSLRSILDELEVLRYGGSQGAKPGDLESLKGRLRPLLGSWHSPR
jgi:hypothetical protein